MDESDRTDELDDFAAQPTDGQSDDRQEFAQLWSEAFDRIRAYVRIFVPALTDAEDVVQEIAVAIAQDFDRYDRSQPFLKWAIGIARFRVLRHFDRRGRDRRMIFHPETVEQLEAAFMGVEPQFDGYREALQWCLLKLPPKSRKLIDARYLASLKASEMAQRFNMTVQAVHARLSQIRGGLRDCILRRMRLTER